VIQTGESAIAIEFNHANHQKKTKIQVTCLLQSVIQPIPLHGHNNSTPKTNPLSLLYQILIFSLQINDLQPDQTTKFPHHFRENPCHTRPQKGASLLKMNDRSITSLTPAHQRPSS